MPPPPAPRLHRLRPALVAGLLLGTSVAAHAVELRYQVVDLPDTVPGQDRWRYDYSLGAFAYDAGYGFTVGFDPGLYAALEAEPAPNADWDVLVVQPDPPLAAEGLYDAEARFDAPDPRGRFRVAFTWLGTGTPGAQPFVVREPEPSFEAVLEGTTVLPEPDGALASASTCFGVAWLAARRGRAERGEARS